MMTSSAASFDIHFDPLLPDIWFAAIIGAAIVLFILAGLKSRRGLLLRSLTFLTFVLTLLNPSLLEEERTPVKDVAVIVLDQSPSQNMGDRQARSEAALAHIQDKLEDRDNLELRIITAPTDSALANETLLFGAVDQALADVPLKRRPGVIIISDGQIHDVPGNPERYSEYGPVHLLLSGERDEKDRQIIISEAPSYGLVGQDISVKYHIEDTLNITQNTATLTVSSGDEAPIIFDVPTNQDLTLELPITHAGQNVFEMSIETVPGELTQSNNKAAIIANGVRDRLRVLLVSGKPHAGGRRWRDLLTSDPGVDLVHFTILRDPGKIDSTPQNELSLIAFPFRELFEIKLYDFDLIIFDRYRLSHILPDFYFDNIVRYVKKGGALLEASGPEFATRDSLYNTSLSTILPGIPTGSVIDQAFTPALTALGKKHPVTENLNSNTQWGPWLRQVVVDAQAGDTLMSGAQDKPLLILNRVGDGRVAQIASDHLWLWASGYEGGGPHTELLRRTVHWLMKEPELDERALSLKISDNAITIKSRSLGQGAPTVTMTKPDGTDESLMFTPFDDGTFSTKVIADQLGIYSFKDAKNQKRFAIIGDLNPPELRGVKATSEHLRPLIDASKGKALWLSDVPNPDIRSLSNARTYGGQHWIGLRQNNEYTVTSVRSTPVLPDWAAAIFLLILLIGTWWRESRV